MNEWPIILDEDAREGDVLVLAYLNSIDETDEIKLLAWDALVTHKYGHEMNADSILEIERGRQETNADLVFTMERIDGEYITRLATLVDIFNKIKMDRNYLPWEITKDIMMHKRCPLDCREYNPKIIIEEVEDAN